MWTTLLLAVLAAGTVRALGERVSTVTARVRNPRRKAVTRRALGVALFIPLALVLAEGLPAYRTTAVSREPAEVRGAARPLLVLPTDAKDDAAVMLWSTRSFPQVANGTADVTPKRLATVRSVARSFPDAASVQAIRALGVTTVVVLRAPATKAGYTVTAVGGLNAYRIGQLGLTVRETPAAIIFTLR